LQVPYCVILLPFQIIMLKKTAKDVYELLTDAAHYPEFRDASVGFAVYTISLNDCLQAIYKAQNHRFFNFKDFSVVDYEHYERVENGDLNWMVPEKIVAFAGPKTPGYSCACKRSNNNTYTYSVITYYTQAGFCSADRNPSTQRLQKHFLL